MTTPSSVPVPSSDVSAVVVGVDGSPSSQRALAWACAEAQRSHRPLHLLHTYDVTTSYAGASGFDPAYAYGIADLERAATEVLAEAVATARTLAPELVTTSATVFGSASSSLVEASRSAHVVVTGARGRGSLAGALLGSVSTQTAMHGHCPVVVVKDPTDPDRPRTGVVVGVDGSPGAQACLAFAFEEASARHVALEVVHAWPFERASGIAGAVDVLSPERDLQPQHAQVVHDSLHGWAEKYPAVPVHVSVDHLPATTALLRHAAAAELLVVGSRGRGGFAGLLLGSVSHAVLQVAGCPVAVVRGLR